MTDDTETERLPRLKGLGNRLTAAELDELRELYWELPSATEAAAELLGSQGPMPTGMRFERFMEVTERVAALIVEIDT
ncbi:MAG TPA: hypothetical protein VNZ06_07080, partial [Steroidobacteraceae bacterium]|nr:hypothetical protein [Steroidobacteraceae bacterium]